MSASRDSTRSDSAFIHVLWGRSDRFPDPQFIAAWPDGLVEAWTDWYYELRAKAIQDFLDFDEPPDAEPWTFWMTSESLARPEVGEPLGIPPQPKVKPATRELWTNG